MKRYAIIVAGGTGARMNSGLPKQFMLLNGKPVLQYSLEAFGGFDPAIQIILVVNSHYTGLARQIAESAGYADILFTAGGSTRFESVKNGLSLAGNDGWVAVHDAARPLISTGFVENLFAEAEKYGSAVPGVPLSDTVRMLEGESSVQLDRAKLRAIQTPQVFRVPELKQAYMQPYRESFTDDAGVMQSGGYAIHLSEGLSDNFKITNPGDLLRAELFLNQL